MAAIPRGAKPARDCCQYYRKKEGFLSEGGDPDAVGGGIPERGNEVDGGRIPEPGGIPNERAKEEPRV